MPDTDHDYKTKGLKLFKVFQCVRFAKSFESVSMNVSISCGLSCGHDGSWCVHKTRVHTKTLQQQADYLRNIKQKFFTEKTRRAFLDSGSPLNPPPPPSISSHCPECAYKMSEEEVLRGFNNFDFNTKCPQCGNSFVSSGTLKAFGEIAKFPCMCPKHTKDQAAHFLEGFDVVLLDTQKVEEIASKRPELAWNAYWHGREASGESDKVADVIQFFLFGTVSQEEDPFACHANWIPFNNNQCDLTPSHISIPSDVEVNKKDANEEEDELPDEEDGVVEKDEEQWQPKWQGPSCGSVYPALDMNEPPRIGKRISRRAVKRVTGHHDVLRVNKKGMSSIQRITEKVIESAALAMLHRSGETLNDKDVDLVMRIWNGRY